MGRNDDVVWGGVSLVDHSDDIVFGPLHAEPAVTALTPLIQTY